MGVAAEREKRFLRAVAGRRQAVGAEPDPGEERDQRDAVRVSFDSGSSGAPNTVWRRPWNRLNLRGSVPGGGRTPSFPSPPACRRACAASMPRRRLERVVLAPAVLGKRAAEHLPRGRVAGIARHRLAQGCKPRAAASPALRYSQPSEKRKQRAVARRADQLLAACRSGRRPFRLRWCCHGRF